MKNVTKKIIATATVLSIASSFAACAADTETEGNTNADENTVITVGANITPHSEILEVAKPILA